jgi:hypothetical protein
MNFKKLIGIVVFILGVILILFSMYAKNRVHAAKTAVHEATGPFAGNPISKTLGSAVDERAEQYNTPILLSLIGGVLFSIAGVSMYLFFRKK